MLPRYYHPPVVTLALLKIREYASRVILHTAPKTRVVRGSCHTSNSSDIIEFSHFHILPKAEYSNPGCSITLQLSDMDAAICYELLAFYVLLKVIISGNPFQPPLHHLLYIWRSNPIRFLSKK